MYGRIQGDFINIKKNNLQHEENKKQWKYSRFQILNDLCKLLKTQKGDLICNTKVFN